MRSLAPLAVCLSVAGCNAPAPPPDTGGTDAGTTACGRGLVVVEGGGSTTVSLVAPDGGVLSSSFISSGSTPTGLSAALSSDVVPPTMPSTGADVVLVDRKNAVLTWVDVTSGDVRAQLDVKTGAGSDPNPQDYARLSVDKGYVTRSLPDPHAGTVPFDGGEDVLVVDPRTPPRITKRIDLAPAMTGAAAGFAPSPYGLVLVDHTLYVLLAVYDLTGTGAAAPSRIVSIDTDTDVITHVTVLDGLEDCTGFVANAKADRFAVVCSGGFTTDASGNIVGDPTKSGVLVLDRSPVPIVTRTIHANEIVDESLGFGIAFVDDDAVLVTSIGNRTKGTGDRALVVDLASGHADEVRTTTEAVKLGGVRCLAACGACFASDAEAGALVRFPVDGHRFGTPELVHPDPATGLPPLFLGGF